MTAPPRLHVVCSEVPPRVVGGLGRYIERMMAAWADLGTTVDVYGLATGPAPRAEITGGVTLHPVRSLDGGGTRTPRPVRPLARIVGLVVFNLAVAVRILRTGPCAVVAVHDWMGCLAGILCRVLGRRTVVFHVHSREDQHGGSGRRSPVSAGIAALETLQARLAALIVVPSDGMRADLVARGWPADRLRVVPHGFDAPQLNRLTGLDPTERNRLRAAVRQRYLSDGVGGLVVFAGRFSPHKGVGTLIAATPLVAARRADVKVVLLGAQAPRTDDDAAVARQITAVGVTDRVVADYRFRPPEDVFAHFLAADVCVFPSTYEPFGLVAVEAMALGRPVVVGPGFSTEVIGDGALRCGRDAPEELADALLRCLDDPAGAGRLGARGAVHVRRHTWRHTAELAVRMYTAPPR